MPVTRGTYWRKPMKVRELIERLKTYNPELPVLLSCDSEGNCYSTVGTSQEETIDDYLLELMIDHNWNPRVGEQAVIIFPLD